MCIICNLTNMFFQPFKCFLYLRSINFFRLPYYIILLNVFNIQAEHLVPLVKICNCRVHPQSSAAKQPIRLTL